MTNSSRTRSLNERSSIAPSLSAPRALDKSEHTCENAPANPASPFGDAARVMRGGADASSPAETHNASTVIRRADRPRRERNRVISAFQRETHSPIGSIGALVPVLDLGVGRPGALSGLPGAPAGRPSRVDGAGDIC